MTVVATTARLLLCEWDERRWQEFVRVTNTPAVMRWLGGQWGAVELADSRERLLRYQSEFGFTFWAVERLEDSEVLGFCGLKRCNTPGLEALHGEIEVGWRLREDAWGQGYAKEAAIASLDLAFDRFEAPRVIALTASGNKPSQGLMTRLGMRHLSEHDFIDPRFAGDPAMNPQVVFAVDRADWPAAMVAALRR